MLLAGVPTAEVADYLGMTEQMVETTYGRTPTAEELNNLVAFVQKRPGREAEAYKHVLWALVTSPEFRFSY